MEKWFLTPEDVSKDAGISVEQAKELIRQLGKHLKNANKIVISGRIQTSYYEKQKKEGFILSGKELMKTERIPLNEKRLLDSQEFCEYVGLGKDNAMKLAEVAGAIFRVGRRVKFDRVKFDRWCDENSSIEKYLDTGRQNKVDIMNNIAVLSENEKGWRKEVNLLSWNDGPMTYDIREWAPEYKKSGNGISLQPAEWRKLLEIAGEIQGGLNKNQNRGE